MSFFKNKYFDKRSYDCTNIVFAESIGVGDTPTHDPHTGQVITDGRWVMCDKTEIADMGCQPLFVRAGVRYYGWL